MNPRSLVATLLEADDLLPEEVPQPDAGEQLDPEAIKDYANEKDTPRPISGVSIRGFYADLLKKLHRHGRLRYVHDGVRGYKVEGNTWLGIDEHSQVISVRLHHTDIICVTPDDTLTVSTGGWETRVTKRRLDDWLPGGWRIYAQAGTWYWWNYKNQGAAENTVNDQGMKILQPFSDGDQIDADGTLRPRLAPKYVKVKMSKAQRASY